MFVRLFLFFLFLASPLLKASSIESFLTSENDSLAIIADFVNAYNGKVVQVQKEVCVQGSDPLELIRYYDGGHHFTSDLGYGVGSNYPILLKSNPYYWKKLYLEQRKGTGFIYQTVKKDKSTFQATIDPEIFSKGYTNCSYAALSGEPSILSTKADGDKKKFTVDLGDGTRRIYENFWKDNNDTYYYHLILEERPNGNKRHFEYIPKYPLNLKRIWTTNNDGSQTLNWLSFSYVLDEELTTVTASNGQVCRYHLEKRKGKAKWKAQNGTNYEGTFKTAVLSHVRAPYLPETSYDVTTHGHCMQTLFSLKELKRPGGQTTRVEYDKEERVKKLYTSLSKDPIYTFDYGSSKTVVKDALGATRTFQFSGRRLSSLNLEYLTQTYKWDAKGQLLEQVELANGQPLRKNNYQYNAAGKITRVDLTSTITSKGANDCYTIQYEYSNDGRNQLLKEIHNGKKTIHYAYQPGTNLKTLKLTSSQGQIVQRQFFSYDKNGILIQSIEDDGKTSDPNNFTGITSRAITEIEPYLTQNEMTLPHWVREYGVSPSGKKELIRATEKFYTQGDLLTKERFFDETMAHRSTKSYEYNEKRQLVKEINEIGEVTTFAYDANFRKIREEILGSGKILHLAYDSEGRLVEERETHENGKIRKTTHAYDLLGNLFSTTNYLGQTTVYTYDKYGRKISEKDPIGKTKAWQYDPLGRPISETDEDGFTTHTVYNLYGSPLEVRYPDGTSKNYRYNLEGHLIEETERDGARQCYTLDYEGRPLVAKTFASGGELIKETRKTYNGKMLASETDGNGDITTYLYDSAARLKSKVKNGIQTTYDYDFLGNLIRSQTGEIVEGKIYDKLSRVIEERTEDSFGKIYSEKSYGYIHGNVALEKEWLGDRVAETRRAYNSQNQLIAENDQLGQKTTHAYEEQGNLKKTTIDPAGKKTVEGFDCHDRLKWVQRYNASETLLAEERYHYDGRGNCVLIEALNFQDGNKIGLFCIEKTYDAMGQETSRTEQGKKKTCYAYFNGRLKTTTLPNGVKLSYTWDHLGQLMSLESSDGTIAQSFTYDRENNLLEANDRLTGKNVLREWDSVGNLIYEKQATGVELDFVWDENGRLKELYLPGGKVSYTWSPIGLLSMERFRSDGSSYQVELDLDPRGKPNKIILPNGSELACTWDLKGRLSSLETAQSSFAYAYNLIDNLTNLSGHDPMGEFSNTYGYDGLNQLISEPGRSYRYDSLHNRREQDEEIHTIGALNETTHDGKLAYSYDANGQRTTRGGERYSYDALGRLTCFEGVETVTYAYDALGRMICRTENGQMQEFLHLFDHEIGMGDAFRLIHPKGATFAVELDGVVYSSVINHRGDICLLEDEGGTLVSTVRFDAYGNVTMGESLSPWLFTGKRFDAAAGLYHFDKREYDPRLGRWLTCDPAGFADGVNLYAYVKNSPMVFVDPNGLWTEEIQDFLGGVTRGAIDDTTWGASNLALGEFQSRGWCGSSGYWTGTAVSMGVSCLYGGAEAKVVKCAGKMLWHGTCHIGSSVAETQIAKSFVRSQSFTQVKGACEYGVRKIASFTERIGISWAKETNNVCRVAGLSPAGSRSVPLEYSKFQTRRNLPEIVNGRKYSGHALDRMQDRGIMSSVVEDTINYGLKCPGKEVGTTSYYNQLNNITVIINNETGAVRTTSFGKIRQ